MSIVRDLGVLVTKRRDVNLKDYVELVKQAANGEVQADDDLLDAIERTGKTAHDFQKDVETLLSRREAVKSLAKAEAMKKDLAKANEVEVKAATELQRIEEEWRKKRADAKRALDNASTASSRIQREISQLVEESLGYLAANTDPLLLDEIASVQAELEQTRESLRAVNDLIMRDEVRDGSELTKACEEIGFDRYAYVRPDWEKRAKRRNDLQELIPQLEAKIEALEKQKLDPERMRWTEGVE